MKRFVLYILSLLTITTFFSCSEEEVFSTNPSMLLTFSEDTVSFDTVISTVPSSTKRILIFNNNKEGIRINQVQLASGTNSLFRINVDGRRGPVVKDLEVLKQDSIFMFVEMTANIQNSNEPVMIKDSILFTLESGTTQKIILEAHGQDAIFMYAPECKNGETMTFTNDRPYVIYDSLKVDSGATLNIEAGATLMFHSGAGMIVYGTLNINGEEGKMVTLRGDRTDKIFTYLPYDRLDAQWEGIKLSSSSTGNTIQYADIHGSNYGIICDSTGVDDTKLTMTNSIINQVHEYGIWSNSNKIEVSNSIISNAGIDCVNITGGNNEFTHCTIANFYALNVRRGSSLKVANTIDGIPYPLHKMYFNNTIITGDHNDEIFADIFRGNMELEKGDVEFNLLFNCCVVTTDTINAGEYFQDCTVDDLKEEMNRRKHFKEIDSRACLYDFHLDSLSTAFEKGKDTYIKSLPKDLYGTPREKGKASIGAVQ